MKSKPAKKNAGKPAKQQRPTSSQRMLDGPDEEGEWIASVFGNEFIWDEDESAKKNYAALGQRLAEAGDLFRSPTYGNGLILMLPNGKNALITRGADLMPVIVDRVEVRVVRDGKPKGSKIDAAHLNSMLKSESFLGQFTAVDQISATPFFLPDFSISKPGFNDGGLDQRILYIGEQPVISNGLDTINSFLDVMAFETKADRTNAVAAALTVLLRNHWQGGKPIILATASKSHAGKDTVILFATGLHRLVSISYQATDWAVERNFVAGVKMNPDIAVIVIENARLDGRTRQISSGFLERFATDPEPQLFSTGTGPAIRVRNNYVLAISMNFGTVSEDLMNRALPIHLHPVGNVADRQSPIGNPKLEFLPTHRDEIAAELYGMIERWKAAGSPLDEDVRHPFSVWAKTVGGILKASGLTDFLANYAVRKTVDDPVRRGLAILGAENPDEWLPSSEWVKHVVVLGLIKTVIPPGDQDSDAGRVRGMGAVLSAHESETLTFDDEEKHLVFKLERKRARFGEKEPHLRYRFVASKESAPKQNP